MSKLIRSPSPGNLPFGEYAKFIAVHCQQGELDERSLKTTNQANKKSLCLPVFLLLV